MESLFNLGLEGVWHCWKVYASLRNAWVAFDVHIRKTALFTLIISNIFRCLVPSNKVVKIVIWCVRLFDLKISSINLILISSELLFVGFFEIVVLGHGISWITWFRQAGKKFEFRFPNAMTHFALNPKSPLLFFPTSFAHIYLDSNLIQLLCFLSSFGTLSLCLGRKADGVLWLRAKNLPYLSNSDRGLWLGAK